LYHFDLKDAMKFNQNLINTQFFYRIKTEDRDKTKSPGNLLPGLFFYLKFF